MGWMQLRTVRQQVGDRNRDSPTQRNLAISVAHTHAMQMTLKRMKEKSLLIALTLLLQQASAQPGLGGSSPTSPVTGLVTRANLQTGNPLPGVNYYGKGYTNHYDYLLNYYYPGQSTAYKLKADQAGAFSCKNAPPP